MIAALLPADVAVVVASAELALEPLWPEEAASAGRMSPDRRREFALGRACARRAMRVLGVPVRALPRAPDRTPRWPDGLVGSLTHCEGYCAAAVAHSEAYASLGIDVERDDPMSERVAQRVCTPAERERLAALPPGPGPCWAKLTFSAKEAFYKWYYPLTGRRLGFQDAEIRFDPAGARFEARLLREDAPPAAGVRRIEGRYAWAAPHVAAALALRR